MEAGDGGGTGVTFFDLLGTLLTRDGDRFRARDEALDEIVEGGRYGVLCNLPRGRDRRDAQRLMEEAGVYDLFEPDLVIVASDLPCPLPDLRAFGVAAALGAAPVADCRFVSAYSGALAAAGQAGMQTVALAPDAGGEAGLLADGTPPQAALLSGEIDEDIGPTFRLAGRVVTMAEPGEVLDGAQLVVSKGRIVAIVPSGQQPPAEYGNAPLVETEGTIYPGLIDLHNHFVYNVASLWQVTERYENRAAWQRTDAYAANVRLPVTALAANPRTAKAIVRYVEAKALIGGTTTGQGMRTKVQGGPKLFRGAMRNVEETDDPRLPEARTRVPSLYVDREGKRVAEFRRGLQAVDAYFYHLAEGVDDAAHRNFTDLAGNDLLAASLVGIHSLGLHAEDLKQLAAAGAKAVWSPFSNLLLYRRTLDLKAVLEAGLPFAIGCDWTPTGSRNLLEELKVARWVGQSQSVDLSSEDLVRAVTARAAEVTAWGGAVGSLQVDRLADLLVLKGAGGDPYDQLIDATESDVALVVVHGLARYGELETMERLHATPERPLERWDLDGSARGLALHTQGSLLNDVSFAAATDTLRNAMSDLHAFRVEAAEQDAQLTSMGIEEPRFAIELDNEYEPTPDEALEAGDDAAALTADWNLMAPSVELDPPTVGGPGYWETVEAQPNLEPGLKQALRDAYGG